MSNMAALFWMIVAYHWRKIQKPKNTDLSINQKVTKSYRQQQLIMSANQILQPTMQIEILTRYRLAHYSCFANHDYQLFINCEELRFQKTNYLASQLLLDSMLAPQSKENHSRLHFQPKLGS